MDLKDNSHPAEQNQVSDGAGSKELYEEENFTFPDGRVASLFEDREFIRVDDMHQKNSTLPLQETPQHTSFDLWLEKKLSWKKGETCHLDFVAPEKASSKQAVIYTSLSHTIDPAALIHSVNNNVKIKELGILFHNAWSREAIHCGPHWPVWQQQATYFFSPKAVNHLLAETAFKLIDAYPVEYLIHKNTIASKKSSHPRTAFWRGPVRSLIHRIGGRLDSQDAGHIFYLFSRDA
ncbi:MAG TPA: hypothetical protein DCF84_03595 [Bacteroidetes bacterium]|nr:hypothetical protein [Bacteroidota bacterium]